MKNDGNEIETVSSELVLPPDASLALVAERHYVNGNPLKGPWSEGLLTIVLGRG